MSKTIVAGFVIACAACVFALATKHDQRVQVEPGAEKIVLLHATRPINRGQMLQIGGNIDFQLIAESETPNHAVRKDKQILEAIELGRIIAVRPIKRGEQIWRSFAENKPKGIICPELRADPTVRPCLVTVATDGSIEGGLIRLGSLVDLHWTCTIGRSRKSVFKVLVDRAKVLMIERPVISEPSLNGRNAYLLTMGLTSDEIAKVVFGQEHG